MKRAQCRAGDNDPAPWSHYKYRGAFRTFRPPREGRNSHTRGCRSDNERNALFVFSAPGQNPLDRAQTELIASPVVFATQRDWSAQEEHRTCKRSPRLKADPTRTRQTTRKFRQPGRQTSQQEGGTQFFAQG